MKIDKKTPPESMLNLSSPKAEIKIRFEAGKMEVVFMPLSLNAKVHGITFCADDRPSIIMGRRKLDVTGVY